MGRPQVSFAKRQREQAKKERQQLKAEKRAQRKTDKPAGLDDDMIIPDDPVDEPEAAVE